MPALVEDHVGIVARFLLRDPLAHLVVMPQVLRPDLVAVPLTANGARLRCIFPFSGNGKLVVACSHKAIAIVELVVGLCTGTHRKQQSEPHSVRAGGS